MNNPDFGLTAEDYGRHRAGFPPQLLDRLDQLGLLRAGHDVVDLGTGTGNLARLIAPRVGSVTGIDPAQALLTRRASSTEPPVSTSPIGWRRPRTRSCVAPRTTWSRPVSAGTGSTATEALIERHNPSWALGGGTDLYPRWLTDLGRAGFGDIRTFSFDVVVTYPPEAWIGRIRASAGVGATLSPDQVERFCGDLRRLLAEDHPADPLEVPHRTWAVVARRASSGSRRRRVR